MAKQPDEQIIKSRARRRLIGAIALALAVVVILPMVLDSEPRITGQDIDLRIPASDKVGEFVPGVALSEVLEAASQAESAVSPQAASDVPVVAKAAASGKITVAEVKPEGLNQAAISTVQAEVRKPEDRPVEVKKLETKPAEVRKIEAKPVEAKSAEVKKPEAKPAETKKPEVKPVEAKKPEARTVEVKQAEQTAGTYIVQVGAYSNAETAALEAEKLKGWGFKAYVQLISGTNRVRVGPYVDRNKADEVRHLLEKHGLQPVITAVK